MTVSVSLQRRTPRSSGLLAEIRAAFRVASLVWIAMAFAMLICAGADLMVGDGDWRNFAVSSGLVGAFAALVAIAARGAPPKATQRMGFLLVIIVWVSTCAVCALPLALYGLSIPDAAFESVSGVTASGSTAMVGLDETPHGVLLWRSILQWFGGIGFLGLGVLILPFLRIGGMQLFSKESSDRSERPVPRFADFARSILTVYVALTVLCMLSYHAGGMSLWEAINHAMTTVSTGGYSTHDASFGYFDDTTLYWIAVVFMISGALPFGMYIGLLFGKRPTALDPQVIVLLLAMLAATLVISMFRADGFESRALATHAFQVVAIVTTTGFGVDDHSAWGPLYIALFYLLMYLGGAAGSTTGGIKTYRLIVVFSLIWSHLNRLLHPNEVSLTRYGGKSVDPAIFRAAMVYLVAFGVALMAGTIGLAATGLDLVTAHTGALTALANVGPALGDIIGPASNFSAIPDSAKWILVLGMLLGRLEIFPVLVLFLPAFWRR